MRSAALLISTFLALPLLADFREFRNFTVDPALEARVRRGAEESLRQFSALKPENLGVTVVDLTRPATIGRASYNGDVSFYPASVIKIFYMADVYLQQKQTLGDVDRALREMIVVSDNDATAYLVDILADTCPGGELQGRALRRFIERRRDINRHFERLGYDIGAMMKPWSFGPYGRELQLLGENRVNRNRLTPDATASLLTWIARRRTPAAGAMLDLLHRPLDPRREDENQVENFIGDALPPGARLWSKAGWTSQVRHDAAYVELPDGRRLVIVVFTRGVSGEKEIIPAITRNLLTELAS